MPTDGKFTKFTHRASFAYIFLYNREEKPVAKRVSYWLSFLVVSPVLLVLPHWLTEKLFACFTFEHLSCDRTTKTNHLPRRDASTILEADVPLSFIGASSVIERSQHRAASQPLAVAKPPADSLNLSQPATPPSRPLSQTEADWRRLLLFWAEKSHEHLIALDESRTVVFATRLAGERFGIRAGMTLDEHWQDALRKDWTFEEQTTEGAAPMWIYLLRRRPASSPAQQQPTLFPAIATKSPLYQKQLQTARIAAHSLSHTLLLGETGSGKEVLARAIHDASPRKNGPFVAVNIASLPKDLIASELFGYADGAFTGAKKGGQPGKFEAASHGTLFLDEIGEMTLELQVLLLRVLEERKITRLGSHTEKELDVRIIAATNRFLEDDVQNGLFRADLYYRLNVLQIRIPPLRERKEDIASLAEQFLHQLHEQYEGGPTQLCETAMTALHRHSWPGNVRELRNVLERAFLHAFPDTQISVQHLPPDWTWLGQNEADAQADHSPLLRTLERETIQQAIREAPSISAAAKKLGIARSTLYRKMSELAIGPCSESHV